MADPKDSKNASPATGDPPKDEGATAAAMASGQGTPAETTGSITADLTASDQVIPPPELVDPEDEEKRIAKEMKAKAFVMNHTVSAWSEGTTVPRSLLEQNGEGEIERLLHLRAIRPAT